MATLGDKLAAQFNQKQRQQSSVLGDKLASNINQRFKNPDEEWNTRRVLANIQRFSRYDQEKASKMYSDLQYLQSDPTSKYYNPYKSITNRAVAGLQEYGIDTSKIDDEFFRKNSYLTQYLKYDGTTNTPTKPGKKSSAEEQAAYLYYQIWKSEDSTKKAEQQWSDLQKELSYWAQRKDRNLSDDQIIDKIDWSKYSELTSMDRNKQMQPNEYNRAIGYSKDAMYGTLWAARNNGGTGDLELDMANSYLGKGNTWKYDQKTANLLNPESPEYLPYATGSTNLDEAAEHFGMLWFPEDWAETHKYYLNGSEDDIKYYNQVAAAEKNTRDAEKAVTALSDWMKNNLSDYTNYDEALKKLDKLYKRGKLTVVNEDGKKEEVDLSILKKMDSTLGDNGEIGTAKLLPMTRGVNYKYSNVKDLLKQSCDYNIQNPVGNGTKFVSYTNKNWYGNDNSTHVSDVITQAAEDRLKRAASTYEGMATEPEQTYLDSSWSSMYDDVKANADQVQEFANQSAANAAKVVVAGQKDVMKDYANQTFANIQFVYDYETNIRRRDLLQAQLDELTPSLTTFDSPAHDRDETLEIGEEKFNVKYSYDPTEGYYAEKVTYTDGRPVSQKDWQKVVYSNEFKEVQGQFNQEVYDYENYEGEYALTEEENAIKKQYDGLKLEIDDLDSEIKGNKEKYDTCLKALDEAQEKFNEEYYILSQYGLDTTDLYVEDAVMSYLVNFADYEATAWNAYNPSDAYRIALAEGKDRAEVLKSAEEGNKQVLADLEDAKAVKQYIEELGANIPENYIQNLDRHIAKLERDAKDYEYFTLQQNSDFDEYVEKGKDFVAQHNVKTSTDSFRDEVNPYSTWAVAGALSFEMTEDENNIYYYLLGKGDRAGAIDYINSLVNSSYGVLHTRYTEDMKKQTEEAMENGGFWGQNILAILASPISSMASLGYGLYSAITGNEINPDNILLAYNNFRTTTRELSAEQIATAYKDDPTKAKAFQFVYEMISNRLDSAVNAATFGGWEGMVGEFVGAVPMGISAGMDAMIDAKRRGASDTQAWKIGTTTFLAETLTEAISLGNIQDALGIGKDMTTDGIKAFLLNWVKKAGPSEALGEMFNDVFENLHDELIMGELSDHANKVWQYRLAGYTETGAELQARLDEIKGIIRTGIMSYMSPGLDIVSYGKGRANHYMEMIKERHQANPDKSIAQVISDYNAEKKKGKEQARKTEDKHQAWLAGTTENGEGAFNYAMVTPKGKAAISAQEAAAKETAKQEKGLDLTTDMEILKVAENSDVPTQTASIAGILDVDKTELSNDRAKAAAARLGKVLGKDQSPVNFLRKVLTGATADNVNSQEVKRGIEYAALNEDSASYKMIQSDAFQAAAPNQQAQMLATSGYIDAKNDGLVNVMNKNVYENRVAEAEKNIQATEDNSAVEDKEVAVITASIAMDDAQKKYDELQGAVEEAIINVLAAKEAFFSDPSDINKKRFEAARGDTMAADTRARTFYENEYKTAQENLTKAESDLEKAKQDRLTEVRQQAVDQVNQEDAKRAEEQAKAEEEARVAEEKEAEQRAEAEAILKAAREVNNFSRLNAEDFVRENFPNAQGEDYNKLIRMVMTAQKASSQNVSSAIARKGFMESFTKKFGLDYEIVPKAMYNARIDPKTGKLQVSKNATQSDVMYAVLVHELTHLAEGSQTYGELADMILGIRYGQGTTFKGIIDALNGGDQSSRAAQDVLKKKGIYDKALNQEHSYEDILKEVVADGIGSLVAGDDKALQQIATKPNLARRIIAALKSFINKCRGLESEPLTMAQQAVAKLEAAVKDAEAKGTVKNSISDNYMSAVENGDMETAQKLVDDYAKESGYNLKAYHGTNRQFNSFRFTEDDIGIHLGTKGQARMKAGRGKDARVVNAYVRLQNPVNFEYDLGAWEGRRVAKELVKMGVVTEQEALNAVASPDRTYWLSDKAATKNIRDLLMSKGYDGFTYMNDYEGYSSKPQQSIAVFDPSQIKLTDAVTYDNDGNIIPLDQRFSDSKDIRYSIPTPVTDSEGNEIGAELPGGTFVIDTQKYSLSSFDLEEQERTRKALQDAKDGNGKRLYTDEQIDRYMEDALSIASMIAADKVRLDFEASDNQVFLKPNNDYYFTLDASTLCAKRLLYQGTFDYVQHAMPDEVFTPEDLIDLVNIMNEMGYETPCGICYVESRRRWLDTYAQKFLDSLPEEGRPSIDDLTTSDGLEKLRSSNPEMYKAFVDAMNKKGTANPKVVQLRTEYRGDIAKNMTEKDVQKVKDIGGLRIQSFSDFETPHLLDMMQAVMDMAARRLTSQAYTKVPNFAWVFGDTGIKINLSLIGKGTGLDENGNLVFDNREGINFDEAMKLRNRYNKNVGTILVGINDEHIIAAMGDPRIDYIIPFHKSGWSQEELRKMPTLNNYSDYTNSQNELMIVGEKKHRVKKIEDLGETALSNWEVREGADHPGYKVTKQKNGKYTVSYDIGYETESFKTHKERTGEKLSNFEPVGANQYWDFKKSGEWNAKKYLKMCAESGRVPKFSQFLVDNGDGTFSLPKGTDKRSTAIREGYWKTLVDFKMYENDGYGRTTEDGTKTKVKGASQQEVTPNINMNEAYRVMNEYQLGRQMPDKENGQKGAFLKMKSNNDVPVATDAGDRYIELIKQRREGKKPVNPDDTLHAAPTIDVKSLGKSAFHQGPGEEANLNAANAFGAANAPAVLGNTESMDNGEYGEQQNVMAIDPETGETVQRYSLPAVEPVEPSSDDWSRDTIQTFPELQAAFPNIYNIQDDRTDEQKKNDTSVAITLSTYRKIFDKLQSEGFDGTILDASSGLGLGTKAGREEYGMAVDDIEPFPDPEYSPSEGTDYSKLNKQYDVIISNAVLNVLTQDERDALVTKMGQLLKNGGRMIINVRSTGDVANLRKNIDTEWISKNGQPSPENPYTCKKNIQIGDNEYYTGRGTYQKGFTPQELASYVQDVLGPDYSISIDSKHETSGSNASGIVVTKNAKTTGTSQKYSLPSDAPYLSAVDHGDMETAQQMVDEKAKEAGYVKAAYHGTLSGGFTVFDKSYSHIGGNSGAGFYFSSNLADSSANYSDVEGADNWFKATHLAEQLEQELNESDDGVVEHDGYKITIDMDYDELVEIAKKILTKNPQTYHVYLDPGRAYIRDFNRSTNLLDDAINGFDESEFDVNDYDSEDDYYDDISMRRGEAIYEAISKAVYNAYSDIESHYDVISNFNLENFVGKLSEIAIDYDSLTWNDLTKALDDEYFDIISDSMEESAEGSREFARAIVENFGYDSIEDREVSKKFNQLKNMGDAGDTVHYIMFRPEQIKSADTVTYDDNGNVIPLSERFNTKQEDIRYSLPSDDVLNQLIQQHLMTNNTQVDNDIYSKPLEGQSPLASTDQGPAQRQAGSQTLQRSDELDQRAKDYIAKYSAYFPETNADQVARAVRWIRSNKRSADSDGFSESVQAVTSKNFDYRSADGQARIIAVMAMAAARGDVVAQAELEDAYNRQGTDLARALQARKIFAMMTPEGRKHSLDRMMRNVQDQLDAKGIKVNLKFSEWISDLAAMAESESDFRKVQKAAAEEIADQIPANWKDRLRAIRMLSMLGNPRTHIRNIVGNALFVPVVGIKNKIGALIELSKPQGMRTKTTSLRLDDAIRAFAKEDAIAMKDILTGEAKYNETNMVDRERKAFKGLFQAVIDWNTNQLEREDWHFLRNHYIRALGGWMQANGYTAADLQNNHQVLEQGRQYAVLEAQKATYRDFNELAKRLNDFVRNPKTLEGKAGALLVEAVLPFKKTPANILRRGLEYSPVGLVKSLTSDLHHMKQYKQFMNGDLKVMPENAISPNEWIDKLASGLTGVGIMAMGALMSSLGLVTCGVSDDDDPDKENGEQKYSLKILGTDFTYTIDWAAPASIPFFVGAALMEEHQDEMTWNDFANSVANIAEPVFNLSMLDGLSSVFKTSKYDDTDVLTQILTKIGTNYVSSYYPAVLGAATRTFADDTQRRSYVPSDEGKGPMGTVRYAWESLKNKIPGASQTSIPARDIWGNEKKSGFLERLFENFISPGYINETKTDPILNEMSRLYDARVADSDNIMPGNVSKSYTYKNNKYVFNAEEYDKLVATRGQTAYEILSQLVKTKEYQEASDSKKVQMIKNVWSYAKKVAYAQVIPDYEYEDLGSTAVQSLARDGLVAGYKDDLLTSIEINDWEGYETMLEALEEAEVEDSKVKEWIGNKYRPLYQTAYRRGDDAEMARIDDLLFNTGFDFDTLHWEELIDEKYGY